MFNRVQDTETHIADTVRRIDEAILTAMVDAVDEACDGLSKADVLRIHIAVGKALISHGSACIVRYIEESNGEWITRVRDAAINELRSILSEDNDDS